jgi:hypothetical protein
VQKTLLAGFNAAASKKSKKKEKNKNPSSAVMLTRDFLRYEVGSVQDYSRIYFLYIMRPANTDKLASKGDILTRG